MPFAYRGGVIGFLRFIGLLNASVWLGGAVFCLAGIGPACSSQELHGVLPGGNFPFFSGAIAHVFLGRCFQLQTACALIALLHVLTERAYLGKPEFKSTLGLLTVLLALCLLGGNELQPTLRHLHLTRYAPNLPAAVHAAAGRSYTLWSVVLQCLNLTVILGLSVYLWRIAHPTTAPRFFSSQKFRA